MVSGVALCANWPVQAAKGLRHHGPYSLVFSLSLHRYGEQMRAISLKYVPTAVLSRQTAGIRGKALVINLPGKPKSIRETFDEVFKSIPYCIQLIEGPYIETKPEVVQAFRPPNDKRAPKPKPA